MTSPVNADGTRANRWTLSQVDGTSSQNTIFRVNQLTLIVLTDDLEATLQEVK